MNRQLSYFKGFLLLCSACSSAENDSHIEAPVVDYQQSPNYGKSMAIFGASFSRIEASSVCKEYWRDLLHITWSDFGINGAGYSNLAQDPGVQYEIDKCRRQHQLFDVYLLWSPTHDFYGKIDIGQQTDYSESDGYDTNKLNTMLGGMNYCYKNIMEMNPEAQILLFTTLPIYNYGPQGYVTDYQDGIGMQHYVDAQIVWAKLHNVHYLDLFRLSGFNLNNYKQYYELDAIHPTVKGYDHIKQPTADFIAFPE